MNKHSSCCWKWIVSCLLVFSDISPLHQTQMANEFAHTLIGAIFDNHMGTLLFSTKYGFNDLSICSTSIVHPQPLLENPTRSITGLFQTGEVLFVPNTWHHSYECPVILLFASMIQLENQSHPLFPWENVVVNKVSDFRFYSSRSDHILISDHANIRSDHILAVRENLYTRTLRRSRSGTTRL